MKIRGWILVLYLSAHPQPSFTSDNCLKSPGFLGLPRINGAEHSKDSLLHHDHQSPDTSATPIAQIWPRQMELRHVKEHVLLVDGGRCRMRLITRYPALASVCYYRYKSLVETVIESDSLDGV
ncbi:hypothetical protein B0T19DRAFT_435185 [Cercophora scortea]|uniref:Secreted protein n=1 Tax=Cercophora scortea TaxID=314031 RepID=A0AAE0M4G5_9PEZI|nr:hypothetical protein B0T19DRAFT_435185 [Cercophora scortea]